MDNKVKLLKPGCVLLALLLIAMVMIPVAGAGTEEAKRVFSKNDTAGYLPVEILSIDPSIKDSTPDYTFLIMSPEGKETRLNDVNLSIDFLYPGDPQNEVLKAGLGREMEEIWDKYPVVFETKPGGPGYPTYGGSIVTVRFASLIQGIRLTEEENSVIKKSALIMNEAYTRKKQQGSPGPSHDLPDSDKVVPTAPQLAAIPAVLTIFALCCCIAGCTIIRIKREGSS
jgi:hypothetical protein